MREDPELDPDVKLAADAAGQQLMRRLDAPLQALFFSEGFPRTLCHYTNFAGLKGILETHSLWATDSRTLNDGTEEQYGTKVVRDYFQTRSGDTPEGIQFQAAMDELSSRTFTTCFCESASVLSMWRAYAGQGGGYCLEFDGSLLSCSFPSFGPTIPIKVAYGDTLSAEVTTLIETLRLFAQEGLFEARMSAAWAKLIALRFKHPAFREENERRIVIRNPPLSAVNFRAGHANIKPYIELCPVSADGLKRLPLRKVVFGPTLRHDDALVDTISMMLERYGYQDVSVEPSGIPYRL